MGDVVSERAVSDSKSSDGAIVYAIKASNAASGEFLFEDTSGMLFERNGSEKIEMGYCHGRVLKLLIERRGEIVSRDDIFSYAWHGRIVTQNSLSQAISKIRDIIGLCDGVDIIRTIPRRGYQLESQFVSVVTDHVVLSNDDLFPSAVSVGRFALYSYAFRGFYGSLLRFPIATLLWVFVLVLVGYFFQNTDLHIFLNKPYKVVHEEFSGKSIYYVSEASFDLEVLKSELYPVLLRMEKLYSGKSTLVFNKSHSFYDVACIDESGAVEFLTIHKARVTGVTDDQLLGCMK